MFTGIIRGLCHVVSVSSQSGIVHIRVLLGTSSDPLTARLETGASIAINGTCLTVVSFETLSWARLVETFKLAPFAPQLASALQGPSAHPPSDAVLVDFDVIQESLSRTNLGLLLPLSDSSLVGATYTDVQRKTRVNVERSMKFGDEMGGHQVYGHVDATASVDRIVRSGANRDVYFRFDPSWSKFVFPKGWISVDGISLTVVHTEPGVLSVSLIPETLARTTLGFKAEGDTVNVEFDPQAKSIVLTMERLLPGYIAGYLKENSALLQPSKY